MANFKVPYEFVAGTKAKAEEVNTNFSAIKEELNKKLDISNDGYITIKDAISDNQPITKAQFESTKEEINNSIEAKIENIALKKEFLFESGNINLDAQPDLLDVDDATKVIFKVDDGTNFKPLKGVLANGISFERTIIADLNVGELQDGIYNLFLGKEGACIPLANNIYRQKTIPIPLVETSFNQSDLSENGVLGGDSFAVSLSNWSRHPNGVDAYLAVDSSKLGNGTQILSNTLPCDFVFYNPNPLKVSKLNIVNRQAGDCWTTKAGVIYGSNDNNNWIHITTFKNTTATGASGNFDILVNSNTAYKYHKIQITECYGYGASIANLTITATQVIGSNLTNAVWLDPSVKPYVSKKYNGLSWEQFDYVPLPQNITVKNGLIVSTNQMGNYNDNGWDNYVTLPDFSRSTILTKNINFIAPLNGWIYNGKNLIRTLLRNEIFTPNVEGCIFYAMKGE